MSLKARLILRCTFAVALTAAMFFIPAGTLRFWQAWVVMGLVYIPMFVSSAYFYKHDPKLVERRMQTKEKIGEQKIIMRLASLVGFMAFLLPGFDYRFGWSGRIFGPEPLWVTISAEVVFLAAYLETYWVMAVNRFAARTIQVAEGQTVISNGPYRMVRHPMYFGASFGMIFAPLALGSYVSLPVFALFIPVIMLRLLNEEKVLRAELAGYAEYCEKTRYRLIPYVW